MSKVIGIDLGSTLSEVAIIEGGKATVIPNEDGSYTTPSVVSFVDGERKVGNVAKRQMIVHPKETINLIKRFMGSTYEESKPNFSHVQYDIVEESGKPRVKIGDRLFSPEEISSYILTKMKKVAEDYCGEEIKDAVITVPAYFSDSARQATKTAGELAGLNVLRIIAEPTAAILSSSISNANGKYMVVDFGGSTEDNSIADIGDGVVEILSTNGDVYLGGSDIDAAVAKYIVDAYKKGTGIDLSLDSQAMTRVIEAVEKAKIELSQTSSTDINLPYISVNEGGVPQHLETTITRAKFEAIIEPIIDHLIDCAKKAVEMAKIDKTDLKGILLIGGSCRIPYVQRRLSEEFGVELIKSSNMDLAVAEGAAIQANNIVGGDNSKDILLIDVTPISIGIETLGGVFTKLVEGNTTIPCRKEETFTTAADNQNAVTLNVLQGERPMAKDNKSIGVFTLDGIMPAPRGVPQIQVTFDIDANAILTVTAKDKGTGKEQHIRIEGGSRLSDDEINRIKEEAKKYEEEDKKAKEVADTINKGDGLVFSNEKMLKENNDKLSSEEKNAVQSVIDEMKEAVKEKNVDKINELEKKLIETWQPISERLYSQSGQQGNSTATSNENEDDADFAEAEEVK